jgi:hypothetical protein
MARERRWVTRKDGIKQRYWFNIPEPEVVDDEEELIEYVEWVIGWEYRIGGLRNFEARLRVPSYYDEDNVTGLGEEIVLGYVNQGLIESSEFTVRKRGEEIISYDEDDYIQYKIIDIARPRYNYPKGRWGNWKR